MATGRVARLGQVIIGSSATTVCTGASSRTTILRDIFVCNTNASSRDYEIHLVKSGESASDANTIVKTKTLAGNTSDFWRFNVPMAAGDTLQMSASAVSSLAAYASGTEYEGTLTPFVPTRFVQTVVANTSTTYYTVPNTPNRRAIIKDLLICNYTGSTPSFTLDYVPSGGSASDTTKIYKTLAMTAYQYIHVRVSTILHVGDTIRATSSASNQISLNIHGALWTES